MTICHHSPNIKSDVQPLHLLAKIGICEGMCMQPTPVTTRPAAPCPQQWPKVGCHGAAKFSDFIGSFHILDAPMQKKRSAKSSVLSSVCCQILFRFVV